MKPEEICVIVQGPVKRTPNADGVALTEATCASIRRHLPGAEIILSTWEDTDVEGLDVDQTILSPDPGPIKSQVVKAVNVNRQLVSSREGMRRATRPYALKFRTDISLLSREFMTAYGTHAPPRTDDLQLFSRRMTAFTSGHPDRMPQGSCFHLADVVLFGAIEDQHKVWDIPLYEATSDDSEHAGDVHRDQAAMTPEQFIWTSVLKQSLGVDLTTMSDAEIRQAHDHFLANNLRILGPFEWRLRMWPGFGTSRYDRRYLTQYSADEWMRLAQAVAEGRTPQTTPTAWSKGVGARAMESWHNAKQGIKKVVKPSRS